MNWFDPIGWFVAFFVIVYFFARKQKVLGWFDYDTHNKKLNHFLKNFYKKVFQEIKLEKGNFKKVFLLPIIYALFWFLLSLWLKIPFTSPLQLYDEHLLVIFIRSIFTNPLVEEFLFRGLIFGLVFWFIKILQESKCKISNSITPVIVAAALQSILFAYFHMSQGFNLFRFLKLMLDGFVYCGFYLYSNRNLLPSTVAHTLANILVWVGVFGGLT